MDRDQLRRWARPEEILRPEEASRTEDFLTLFAMQLELVCEDREPTIVEAVVARRVAEIVWEFDRTTSSKVVTTERKKKPSRMLERIDHFEENEIRHRLNQLALDEIDSARLLGRVAAGAVEVRVLPFRKTGTG